MKHTKITLTDSEIPEHYLNIAYYLKKYLGKLPDPPLNPATRKPISPDELKALFPDELVKQEVSFEEKIPIPDEVREIYKLYRPTQIGRASCRERV